MKVVISDIHIDVVRKDIKNMHLAVYPPKGKVRLATPRNVTDETIRLFTISKLGWIKKQQRRFTEQLREPSRKYVNRESHYFFGKRYLFKVMETEKGSKVIRRRNQIELHVRRNSSVEQRRFVLSEWYRNELKKVIPNLVAKWEKRMGVSVRSWGVRKMKTKWGTCNIEARRIWLNLELAKKPIHCLEYIIVHELTHLLERKHNEHFLALMNLYMPQWKTYRKELNEFVLSQPD